MEQYELDPKYLEAATEISKVGQLLRDDAISKNFSPEAEYKRQLNILTGWYMYVVVEFKKWRAIKENNEVAKFCQLKSENTTKFTAASAQPEASNFVGKERYLRDFLEGLLMSAEQGIYTIKKHLGSDTKEEQLS